MGRIRVDNLPMDRQTAGTARKDLSGGSLFSPSALAAVYEKRDVDPEAQIFQRRHGSTRSSTTIPNILGIAAAIDKGRVVVDKPFTDTTWTVFATLRLPLTGEDSYAPLFNYGGVHAYIYYDYPTNAVHLRAYEASAESIASYSLGDLDTDGVDYRIMVRLVGGAVSIVGWPVPAVGVTPSIDAEVSGEPAESLLSPPGSITIFGPPLAALIPSYDGVVITNLIFYNKSDFNKSSEYEVLASDLTPAKSGTNAASTAYKVLWHETFTAGGDSLTFENSDEVTLYGYVVPSLPTVSSSEIHFGGLGAIEIPFYLDFDEYYWTPTNSAARLEWMFQIELTLPNTLASSTIFEFQDILRLILHPSGGNFVLRGSFAGTGVVTSTLNLVAGTTYQIFVGRNLTQSLITVTPDGGSATATTATTIDNPAIFNYDQMLGFVIGDTVDRENTQPFGGRIKRFALHNESGLKWHPLKDAVLYYDSASLIGDQVIDRGNRALNSFATLRVDTAPPYYNEGGFKGGSYVVATGGYVMTGSKPDVTYTGELSKAITKDAVVQRRGDKAFMTTNGVNYLIDDYSKSFRPLGISRPTTKVSCSPQGVGSIDGFVRYAYRWVTKDGTVGPAFDLDPVDARDGVNVFLGAENFGLPGETPFGISFGEMEGMNDPDTARGDASAGTVEAFFVQDNDGEGSRLLRKEIKDPGLTLEIAARIPDLDNVKESIFSQGAAAPAGTLHWGADQSPFQFSWAHDAGQEFCAQVAFRYDSTEAYQTLLTLGRTNQEGGNGNWRLHTLCVSIQPPLVGENFHSIVVTRDAPAGSNHHNNDLHHHAWDYNFVNGRDYSVFVQRGRNNGGQDLLVSIYDQTSDRWDMWPEVGGSTSYTEVIKEGFWPTTYGANTAALVMWGISRHEGSSLSGKSRKRAASGSSTFNLGRIPAFDGGGLLYHGRLWRRAFPQQVLNIKALDRYGATNGSVLDDLIEVDCAFCPDSNETAITGGWDIVRDMRVPFFEDGAGAVNATPTLTTNVDNTPILTYGWNMATASASSWTVTSLDNVPLWINWSSRNEGSLSIGVGSRTSVEIAKRKWYPGANILTFDAFAGTLDLKQWTWITLYLHHAARPQSSATYYDVWLERVFIDGNTGDWGHVYDADIDIDGIAANASGTYQNGLFMVGGLPGMDQEFQVEVTEVRLWDGERYTAQGGGDGLYTFGTYLSSRVPPNLWDKLWHYLRFNKIDTNDPASQTTMDQFGSFIGPDGRQLGTNAVKIVHGSEVVDLTSASATQTYFVPFPEPPLSAIRGIQIFRTQVVPVSTEYPNGNPNPNALSDAWRATRDAPLYFLSEIPRGTTHYLDTAPDGALGTELDATTGLIPRDPKGVFEWEGYLGVYVGDRPRIHFAESPTSWESFPTEMIFDLPVREYGPIEAAIELASRDARQSRVLCLGKSWGVFLDGSPAQPQSNSLGGGVGASSSRCLVVEKGIAYAYNGTLWAISGDGQVEDIGLPILDLLPDPDNARLSISSALSSLFIINESTGLVLRFHLARRQWFVEDRYALSVTDIDGVDNWVHVSGYPSAGDTAVYQDDVAADTPEVVAVSSYSNGADTITVASSTGLTIGQRLTVVGDRGTGTASDPRERATVTIKSIAGNVISVEENLNLNATTTLLDGSTPTVLYNAYPGVGYWGTMIDTGQFVVEGSVVGATLGISAGSGWWAAYDAADFAKDPSDRTGFAAAESKPTSVTTAARWGLSNQQRLERLMLWSPRGELATLTEMVLDVMEDKKGD